MPKKDLTAENIQPESQENIEKDVETSSVPETDLQDTIAEEPITEEFVLETPVVEVLVSKSPEVEEPVAETPEAEEIISEMPAVEEPVAETPAAEEIVSEMPVVEEPVAETPEAEEIISEMPVVEEPVAETPAAEEIVSEMPVVEEPVAETPAEEEIVSEIPVVEKQVAEIPVVQDTEHHPEIHADAAILQEIAEMDVHGAEAEIEEEEEEAIEFHEEILEKYDDYDRDKLVDILEETVKEENILKIKTRVALIKVAFLRLSKEYRQLMLDNHIQAGGTRENYTPATDPLIEKFNHVFETYKKNKIKFNEQQEVVKLRNLDAKKAILEELKELINSEETLKKTYDQFKDLQVKWKEIGLVPSTEINNLWQNYHFLVEKFFDKVKISKELRDLDLKKNLERKMELCEKAEELLIEPSVIRSFQQLQKYHEEWKEIGPVPQDKRDEIWERFKTATDKINERRREHYNELTKDQDDNLAAKTALCEKAEQLASMEIDNLKDWQDRTREVNELFKVWKTIGPAPKKENDEVWEKFKTFLNGFFTNKKEFFSKIKQEQLNNFNLKLDIVKQAEALKESDDWRKTTQELINLQKEWKNIGPVPRKHSDKIWKRFRAACDEFFHNKAKFFSTVVESEKENLDKKLDLIRRIEEWSAGKDKTANLETLKGFQREFTEIGHVPIKDKNRVHDAFRQAINKHFDGLKISSYEMRPNAEYRSRQESSYDNADDGRYQRRSGGGGEWSTLSTKVSKLREEILLWENNIGFLAHSKKADLLRQEFEKKIQDAKLELAQLEAKLKTMQD
jgi:hypothetical protein